MLHVSPLFFADNMIKIKNLLQSFLLNNINLVLNWNKIPISWTDSVRIWFLLDYNLLSVTRLRRLHCTLRTLRGLILILKLAMNWKLCVSSAFVWDLRDTFGFTKDLFGGGELAFAGGCSLWISFSKLLHMILKEVINNIQPALRLRSLWCPHTYFNTLYRFTIFIHLHCSKGPTSRRWELV